jgi:sec-independent protein translocase protein TatA
MMGSGEILVIMVVILILFGGKKLPEFAQSLGKGIREFKKACNGEDEAPPAPPSMKNSHPPTLPVDSSDDRS